MEHFYDKACAIGVYEKALLVSILNLKKDPHLCKKLHKFLLDASENILFNGVSVIMPIPLSKERMLERGFNQAQILAKAMAKHLNVECDSSSLIRTKHSKVHRAGMDKKAREMSVEKSFELKRTKKLEGKEILLIDDVLASGATVSNCAKVLKNTGAKRVYVLTLARAR